jgi:hypothetical protein
MGMKNEIIPRTNTTAPAKARPFMKSLHVRSSA